MKELHVDSSTVKAGAIQAGGIILGFSLEQVNTIASIIVLVLTGIYTVIKIVQALKGKK